MKNKTQFKCSRLVKYIMILACTMLNHAQANSTTDPVTLEWDPPTMRTDGSLLTAIVGYQVHYGTSSGVYGLGIQASTTNSISISDLMSLMDPEEGQTYYFVVTAVDDTGQESAYSEEFSWRWWSTPHTVNHPTPHWWLAEHGITEALEDVVGMDLDGDGVLVWQEYVMDSDPTDATSHLAVLITPYHENGDPAGRVIGSQIEWRGSTQRVYKVEFSTDLQTWAPVPELEHIEPSSEWIAVNALFESDDPLMFRVEVRLP